MGMFSTWGSPFLYGDYRMETGRETWIFPYGESPFPNRVCFHLGTNIDTGNHTAKEVCISIVDQKPSNSHGTGHLGLCLTSSIVKLPIATTHPANYRQKASHGGKTAQGMGRADKA
jgi:hypothetical protein